MNDQTCPLCKNLGGKEFYQDSHRDYVQCQTCHLVFVPPTHFISAEAEKSRYDLHQNSPNDPKYRQFLSRLFHPMQTRLTPESRGLDFGSGPGPTLSVMFKEIGHSMAIYDYYYAKDETVWEEQYDFITASEVVEHLRKPGEELERLWACLKINGLLGLMTKLVLDRQAFARWHYKNDLTHISYFSRKTFEWLGEQWGTKPNFVDKDVILFKKPVTTQSATELDVSGS
ncbi:MAG: class I SAM-dependent methyltransferase [Chloroflexi bacterium]|nr:class I SAM-dependent methyltransferase [Chloroflexota bacterium]